MDKLPSAEEIYNDFHFNYKDDENYILEAMRYYAKLHVTEALNQAAEKSRAILDMDDSGYIEGNVWARVDEKSILSAYPLDLIQ